MLPRDAGALSRSDRGGELGVRLADLEPALNG